MPPLAPCDVSQSLYYGFTQQPSYNGIESGSKPWTVGNSSCLYRVHGWGAPYFCINEQGNMAVRPHGESTLMAEEIDIMNVVQRVVNEGMSAPLIIRFPNILHHRLSSLHAAFERGILLQGYQGRFQGVFPVKCNPDRFIVEEIVTYRKQHLRFGLEAGSKPELMMAMGILCGHGHPEAFLICNGYKDVEYVHMALLAQQMGVKAVIVLEHEEELEIVIQVSERLGVQPVIGVRAKLSTKHDGHWGATSGEKGKFGLTPSEIVGIVANLRRVGMLDCLQLLHSHIGSQIPSLELVNEGVSEAAHMYCELSLMGANMNVIDIGGGLGVDYDGSNSSSSEASIGYDLDGYAEQVVNSIKLACSSKNVKSPLITSESGRALVSHQSIVVFDVLSAHAKPWSISEDIGIPLSIEGLPHDMAAIYEELSGYVRSGKYDSAFDCAGLLKAEGTRLFKCGLFTLERRAMVDKIFDTVKALTYGKGKSGLSVVDAGKPESGFRKKVADEVATYHVNLSIFRSMPDSWAISQLFPFAPLHRHQEEPSTRAILSDLTCDSDGKIDTFIGHGEDMEPSNFLHVHPLIPKKPYYIGMFLAGAYQESLGNMHNLFGTPNVVHVCSSSSAEGFKITVSQPGQTIGSVLRVMQHTPDGMFEDLRARVEDSLIAGRFKSEQEAVGVLHSLACSFSSYTYLSNAFARSKSERYAAVEQAYSYA